MRAGGPPASRPSPLPKVVNGLYLRKPYALLLSFTVASASALFLFRQAQAIGPGEEPVPVVYAKAPVRALQPLPAAALEVREIPRRAAPAEALAGVDQAAGKVAAQDILPGQVLLPGMLIDAPMRRGLLEGEVAFEVPLAQNTGLYLRPGDSVDVIATPQNRAQSGQPPQEAAAQIVARGLRVVALKTSSGADVDPDKAPGGLMGVAGGPAVAVLAVPADLVPLLAWHLETAKVRLVVDPWNR